ncbi:hypothetical protein ACWCXB_05345 [Streptomyces sp. NPDC001514]
MELVAVQIQGEARARGIEPLEEDVGPGTVQDTLLGHPPPQDGAVLRSEPEVQRVRPCGCRVCVGSGPGVGLSCPVLERLDAHDLQVGLGLSRQR